MFHPPSQSICAFAQLWTKQKHPLRGVEIFHIAEFVQKKSLCIIMYSFAVGCCLHSLDYRSSLFCGHQWVVEI